MPITLGWLKKMKFLSFVGSSPKKLPFDEKTTEFLKNLLTKEILDPTRVKPSPTVKNSYFMFCLNIVGSGQKRE